MGANQPYNKKSEIGTNQPHHKKADVGHYRNKNVGASRRNYERPRRYGVRCQNCDTIGHVMSECWYLKGTNEGSATNYNLLVSSVNGKAENSAVSTAIKTVKENTDPVRRDYLPFVSQGTVSLSEDCSNPIPIRILRDTGATQSLLLQEVLPFDNESATGESVLAQGIEGGFINVPLHKVFLKSDIVSGLVNVGLRPTLPVKGIALLLGNDLAGGKVSPFIHLTSKINSRDENATNDKKSSELYPACAVT